MISIMKEIESLFTANFIEQKWKLNLNNVNIWFYAYILRIESLLFKIYIISLRYKYTISNELKRSKI